MVLKPSNDGNDKKEFHLSDIIVTRGGYPPKRSDTEWPTDPDLYAEEEWNEGWLESLDERAEELNGARIGRRIFCYNHNRTKFIVEVWNPFNYEDYDIEEYISEAHYLQIQQQQKDEEWQQNLIQTLQGLAKNLNANFTKINYTLGSIAGVN